jgi:hypothetical protein
MTRAALLGILVLAAGRLLAQVVPVPRRPSLIHRTLQLQEPKGLQELQLLEKTWSGVGCARPL